MKKALLAVVLIVFIAGSLIITFNYIPKMLNPPSEENVPSKEHSSSEFQKEDETKQYVELNADLYSNGGQWMRDSETDLPLYEGTMSYAVSNYGTATADSIEVTIQIDGVVFKQFSLLSLAPYDSSTGKFSISIDYDDSKQILLSASCQESEDADTLTVDAILPRVFDSGIAKLYITPKDPVIEQTLGNIIKNPILPDWIEIRDWIGNNIEYEYDDETHGVSEYWQLPRETLSLGKGDCEDFSILLCSLYRAVGWNNDEVYVVLGEKDEGHHAWVKLDVDIIGWQNIEPQYDGWNTIIGDFFALSGYDAKYNFNDVYLKNI